MKEIFYFAKDSQTYSKFVIQSYEQMKEEILEYRLMEAVVKGRGGARRRLNKGGEVGGGGGGGTSRHHQPAGLQEQCQCPPL